MDQLNLYFVIGCVAFAYVIYLFRQFVLAYEQSSKSLKTIARVLRSQGFNDLVKAGVSGPLILKSVNDLTAVIDKHSVGTVRVAEAQVVAIASLEKCVGEFSAQLFTGGGSGITAPNPVRAAEAYREDQRRYTENADIFSEMEQMG